MCDLTMAGANGNGSRKGNRTPKVGTDRVKQGLAQMLKGGVIVSLGAHRPYLSQKSVPSCF